MGFAPLAAGGLVLVYLRRCDRLWATEPSRNAARIDQGGTRHDQASRLAVQRRAGQNSALSFAVTRRPAASGLGRSPGKFAAPQGSASTLAPRDAPRGNAKCKSVAAGAVVRPALWRIASAADTQDSIFLVDINNSMNSCEPSPTAVAEPVDAAEMPLAVQFLRYLIVGGVAFLADFGTLALLTSGFGWHYLQSAAVAFGIGTVFNYIFSVRWVFDVRAVKNHRLEFLFFVLIGLAGLGINHLLLWMLTDGLNVHYLQSKLVTAGGVLIWNFAARKLLLFSATQSVAP